jgi:hypothetical protein
MERSVLIKEIIAKIHLLPDIKIQEINDFAEFLLSRIDDQILLEGIQKLATDSKSFEYLKNEENLYLANDLKAISNYSVCESSLAKDWFKPEEGEAWKNL